MNTLARVALYISCLLLPAGAALAQELQFASLGDFKLESGEVIRDCRIGYRTFGKLNAGKTNAILFATWASGTSEQLKSNVGSGRVVDDATYYVVAIDALGNGVSSSPSNSKLQPRMQFPKFTIGDMVRTQHWVLTKVLGLTHLRAAIGISMGGMQAFQWSVSYPDFMDQVIPIVGSPQLAPYDLLHWQTQIDAIMNDRGWNNGNYSENPARAAEAEFGALLLTTPQHYNKQTTRATVFADLEKAKKTSLFDANDKIRQDQAMMALDITAPFSGSLERAAAAVKAKVFVIVAAADHVVTPGPAMEFARLQQSKLLILESDCGHQAPGCESQRVNQAVSDFLAANKTNALQSRQLPMPSFVLLRPKRFRYNQAHFRSGLRSTDRPVATHRNLSFSRRNRGMMSHNRIVVLCYRMLSLGVLLLAAIALEIPAAAQGSVATQGSSTVHVMGDPVDVSQEFGKGENTYFVGSKVTAFDPANGSGSLQWNRYMRRAFFSFNKMDRTLTPDKGNEFPAEYDENPTLPFVIEFVSPRTIRLRMKTSPGPITEEPSLMLVGNPPKDNSWKVEQGDKSITYRSAHGSVTIIKDPWEIQIRDKSGKLLTATQNINITRGSFSAPLPFSFVRRAEDFGRQMAAAFRLSPDEKIFGLGESFTRLNKRGQKIIVMARDGMGVQTSLLYKPIPFFMSSNGYGMFLHTSTPITMDIGNSFDQSNIMYLGDGALDCFIFLGDPKDILSEYTALTGRSPVPPLWSFGFWMSRITYKAEDEVRDVAAKLRQHRIPTDVIHLDTGWFETDWRSDYKFSTTRFRDPAKMIADLKRDGFHISLWQYTYFTRKNSLFPEIVNNGLAVRNPGGLLPDEDATLDFSNPETVKWYQDKLAGLLKQGVGAIKVDFGEGAPYNGLYASGRTGLYEHNLYPLRYNKAVADITKQITGDSIIWARSAWAGSQRYPLHWGGDAENTNSAMAAELRGGLSFGLSGFTYWSHDAGGFVERAPRDLYRRWLGFGVLTSHTRAHGVPPREPWEYDPEFVDIYRRTVELKYSLMPYIIAQAKESSAHGYPMLRTLFFEYPNDPTSWLIEDQYMFGSDLLVAPLIEDGDTRKVYLPPGSWIDYQSGKVYAGGQWHQITAGQVPVIALVKDHSVIPHIAIAQSTSQMDWKNIELRVFSTDRSAATGLFALPDGDLQKLNLTSSTTGYALASDPLSNQVKWRITRSGGN